MQTTSTKIYIVKITAESRSGHTCKDTYTFSSLPTLDDVRRYTGDYQSESVKIVSAQCVETVTVQSRRKVTVR